MADTTSRILNLVQWDCEDGYTETYAAYETEDEALEAVREIMLEQARNQDTEHEDPSTVSYAEYLEAGEIQEWRAEESDTYHVRARVKVDDNYALVVCRTVYHQHSLPA